jgi:hypothetical protein
VVNWEWMASKRHTVFDKIKATCDELGIIGTWKSFVSFMLLCILMSMGRRWCG